MQFFSQAASPAVSDDCQQRAGLTPRGGWPARLSVHLPGWPMDALLQRMIMSVSREAPAQYWALARSQTYSPVTLLLIYGLSKGSMCFAWQGMERTR